MSGDVIAPGAGLRKRQRLQEPLGRGKTTPRFTCERPCPVCGGYDRAPGWQGSRCLGFASTRSESVYCTREEYAGSLPFNRSILAYQHTLEGPCGCANAHQASEVVRATPRRRGNRAGTPRLVGRYDY
jgi:hypothetical protein